MHSAETGSSSYGLSFRFQLLSTSLWATQLLSATCVVTPHRVDLHHADKASSQTHSYRRRPVSIRAGHGGLSCFGMTRACWRGRLIRHVYSANEARAEAWIDPGLRRDDGGDGIGRNLNLAPMGLRRDDVLVREPEYSNRAPSVLVRPINATARLESRTQPELLTPASDRRRC